MATLTKRDLRDRVSIPFVSPSGEKLIPYIPDFARGIDKVSFSDLKFITTMKTPSPAMQRDASAHARLVAGKLTSGKPSILSALLSALKQVGIPESEVMMLLAVIIGEGGYKDPTKIVISPAARVYGLFQFTKTHWTHCKSQVASTDMKLEGDILHVTLTLKGSIRGKYQFSIPGSDYVQTHIEESLWGAPSQWDQLIPSMVQALFLLWKAKAIHANVNDGEINDWVEAHGDASPLTPISQGEDHAKQGFMTILNIYGWNSLNSARIKAKRTLSDVHIDRIVKDFAYHQATKTLQSIISAV